MPRIIVGAAALALLAYSVALVALGDLFPAPGQEGADPDRVVLFVVATAAVALLHVGACLVSHRRPPRLLFVLVVAVGARLVLLFGGAGPVLEGEPQRVRFDARLVNQGVHPYEFRPGEIAEDSPQTLLWTQDKQARLSQARARVSASADAPRPAELRRPDLRTGTLPLGLWVASIADRFKPSSPLGLAFFALVADVLAIYLLLLALKSLGKPAGWIMVYAWSPILLKEIYCTLSMDAFLMPALAGLAYCLASGRRLLTAVPLALAAGLHLPFLLLAPVLGRRLGLLGVSLVVLLFAGPFLPFWTDSVPLGTFFETQIHAWRHQEYNSILESPLRGALSFLSGTAENTLSVAGVELARPGEALYVLLVKILLGVCLLGFATYLAIRNDDEDPHPAAFRRDNGGSFAVIAALILVAPVLHASTAMWLLPLLVLAPRGLAWLTLPALVSIGHLTHLVGPDAADLVWGGGALSYRLVSYGLFAVLLLIDWRLHRQMFDDDDPAAQRVAVTPAADPWEYELPQAEPVHY